MKIKEEAKRKEKKGTREKMKRSLERNKHVRSNLYYSEIVSNISFISYLI